MFSVLSHLNYFAKVSVFEQIVNFVVLLKNSKCENLAETIKAVLLKNGVQLNNELIKILVR